MTRFEEMLTTELLEVPKEEPKKIHEIKDNIIIKEENPGGNDNGNKVIRYTSEKGYKSSCYLTKYPTGNCQISSISYFYSLLDTCSNEEIVKILKYLREKELSNKMFLVDVRIEYKKLLKYFKPIAEMPYKSSNGSNMIIAIINTELL